MPVVPGMPVTIMQVIDMITMGYGDVSAPVTVLMCMIFVRAVPCRFALIYVISVDTV